MNFKTIGNLEKPAALLIHAMYATPESFNSLVRYLKDDYYLIMPILDGHDPKEQSTFISAADEADKILKYLLNNNIKNLSFILGTSLGAIIAMEVYSRNQLTINKVFLDGGPFFKFNLPLKIILKKIFWEKCLYAKSNPKDFEQKLNNIFPGMGPLMINTCLHIDKTSVYNLVETCYSCKMPSLSTDLQKKITFLYGSKEPARFCIHRLNKYSVLIKKIGFNHCEFLLKHPKEYAKMLNNS